jgi:hypothetical protein
VSFFFKQKKPRTKKVEDFFDDEFCVIKKQKGKKRKGKKKSDKKEKESAQDFFFPFLPHFDFFHSFFLQFFFLPWFLFFYFY